MREYTVLSLFDGMGAGRLALERAGYKVKKYYASEIAREGMSVSSKHYPDIVHLGDVTKWKEWESQYGIDFGEVDILLGGSPCQGFSIAGKKLNFEDERSKLFFEYAEILKYIQERNPNVIFLLENVAMNEVSRGIISDYLGVEPIEIDSNLLSAQNRKRLYWTNIQGVTVPSDKGVLLKHIVHEYTDGISPQTSEWLSKYLVPFDTTFKILEAEDMVGKAGYFRQDSQANRVYYINGKAVTLCGSAGGGAAKMGQYLFGCITPDRVDKRQNGYRFNTGEKFYTLTAQDKHGVLLDGYIRKLTPIECERLQTVPDNYTQYGVDGKELTDTQRYRLLGNGWTIDVIAYILKAMSEEECVDF